MATPLSRSGVLLRGQAKPGARLRGRSEYVATAQVAVALRVCISRVMPPAWRETPRGFHRGHPTLSPGARSGGRAADGGVGVSEELATARSTPRARSRPVR